MNIMDVEKEIRRLDESIEDVRKNVRKNVLKINEFIGNNNSKKVKVGNENNTVTTIGEDFSNQIRNTRESISDLHDKAFSIIGFSGLILGLLANVAKDVAVTNEGNNSIINSFVHILMMDFTTIHLIALSASLIFSLFFLFITIVYMFTMIYLIEEDFILTLNGDFGKVSQIETVMRRSVLIFVIGIYFTAFFIILSFFNSLLGCFVFLIGSIIAIYIISRIFREINIKISH